MYSLDKRAFAEAGITDTLHTLLRDRDALVVSNVLTVLNEILSAEGGLVLSQVRQQGGRGGGTIRKGWVGVSSAIVRQSVGAGILLTLPLRLLFPACSRL